MKIHRRSSKAPHWVETRPDGSKIYHEALVLCNVTTEIDADKLAESRRTGNRLTCAWMHGEWADEFPVLQFANDARRVQFDPLWQDAFHAGLEPFDRAAFVLLRQDGSAWALL